MKKIVLSSVLVVMYILALAQVPEYFSYQVIVRDVTNNPIANQSVSFRMSILKSSISGSAVYSELHSSVTNTLGLVTLAIGNGTGKTGDFSAINWGADIYFLKVEIDVTGGSAFVEMGTTQLLSVPYALHAKTASGYIETDPEVGSNTTSYLSKWNGAALVSSSIFDNGKIGIGTNTPSEMLHIKTSTPDGNIRLQVSDNDGYYLGYNNGGNYMAISVTSGGTFYGDLMNLKAGNVGIGTTNPSTRLQVNGIITSTGANITGTTTVPAPVNPTDAATKAYVDDMAVQIGTTVLLNYGYIDPRDNNHYNVVKIGNQIWMAENLKYLPSVVGPGTGSITIPYYYVYGYDGTDVNAAKSTSDYNSYGVLYNWAAAMNGASSSSANPSGVQCVCPTGWHLPSDAEWTQLTTYLGGQVPAGGKLKEAGLLHWNSPNTSATNETSFTALPGGYRNPSGAFEHKGNLGEWWNATEYDSNNAKFREMYYDNSAVAQGGNPKSYGYSVRCVKD